MYNKNQIKAVSEVLKRNKTNYWTGLECKKFEKEFSKYHNTKYSIAVSNGSIALELGLKALNLKNGDEVIVTPRSFIISASCVVNLGLKPVFADVDKNGNLDIKEISKVYNKRVKAIIIVHLNGMPCELNPIVKFAKKNKVFLIEDCAQSHGAKYKGKPVGSFGDVATWSFCQDKIISTGGEGGMISTNNKKIWKKCWSLKDHGKDFNKVFFKKFKTGYKWLHDHLGSNYRMTEMQASIGRIQLKELDNQIKKRNQIVKLYIKHLDKYFKEYNFFYKLNFKCSGCDHANCQKCVHAFYRFNLVIKSKKIKQLKLINDFNKNNIKCLVGACPEIYREKIFKKSKFSPKKRLPNAKFIGQRSITFPINPYISLKIIKKDIKIIDKILSEYI
jgi:dTDP-4-amino-4,6-dideoxygalactose transaminase